MQPHVKELIFPDRPEAVAEFVQQLTDAGRLNADGSVTLDDAKLRSACSLLLSGREFEDFVAQHVKGAKLGFAVPAGGGKPLFPWALVLPFIAAKTPLPTRVLKHDLGIIGATNSKEVGTFLKTRFASVPDLIGTDSTHHILLRNNDRGDGWAGGPDPDPKGTKPPWKDTGGTPGYYTPPLPLPDATACLTSLGTWSASWWGVQLCVDDQCAQSIADAITQYTLAGDLKSFASAAASAASAALSGTSLIGLVVAIAIAFYGGVLRINILTEDQRSNGKGVCLYFSWFVGPIVWAVAR